MSLQKAEQTLEEAEHERKMAAAARVNKKAKRELAEAEHLKARATRSVAEVVGGSEEDPDQNVSEAKRDVEAATKEHERAKEDHKDAEEDYQEAKSMWERLDEMFGQERGKDKPQEVEAGPPRWWLLLVWPLVASVCVAGLWVLRPKALR